MNSRLGLLVVVLSLVVPQMAQERVGPPVRSDYPVLDDSSFHTAGASLVSPEELRIRHNAEVEMARRQVREVRAESEQLAALANQLKAEVDRSGGQALSLEAMKKAQQIEKLAKHIRTQIKGM